MSEQSNSDSLTPIERLRLALALTENCEDGTFECEREYVEALLKEYDEQADAIAALRAAAHQSAPGDGQDGWQLVPVEPSQEMVRVAYAGQPDSINVGFAQAYRDMLAAAPKSQSAPPTPQPGAMREALDIDDIAKWLHDETAHPESYPDYTWPETERDDGRRDGGWVKIVPQHAQAYFRDIARRLVARYGAPP